MIEVKTYFVSGIEDGEVFFAGGFFVFLDCLDAIASSERALRRLVGPELIHALKG